MIKNLVLPCAWRVCAICFAMLGAAMLHAQPGSADPAFKPAGSVNAFALQPDGKIVVSGEFGMGSGFRSLARLNSNGSLDSTFSSVGPDGPITHLVMMPGGQVLVGGDYGQFGGQSRIRLARLLSTGALDPDWNPGSVLATSTIGALAVQPDGSTLIGIDNIGGAPPGDRLVRLRPDGTRDTNFLAVGAVNGSVLALHFLPNGDFYIGGRFTAVHGVSRAGIARLKADGSLDATFDPGSGVNGEVRAMGVQLDGRVLISGEFDQVAGVHRMRLARLHPDGRFDSDFDAAMTGTVLAMAMQTDGKMVLAGMFYYVHEVRRGGMARLLPDGALDPDFVTGEGYFRQVAIQPDGMILAGGGSSPGLFRFLNGPGNFPGRFELDPVLTEVVEGAGDVTITVRRYGGQAGVASVSYAATLYSKDLTRGRLTFMEGEREKAFVVPIPDDREVDPGRTISLLLYEPSAGAQLGFDQYGEIRVEENDTGFDIERYPSASEDSQVLTVQVARLGADFSPAMVDFTTVDGTAKAGHDYVARSGTLHFAQGETGQAISIALLDNPEIQGLHTFSVVLSHPSDDLVLIHGGVSSVTLGDVVSQIAFAGYGDYATNEAAGVALIPVQRTGRTNNAVRVHYQTSNGTAKAEVDYQTTSGTLSFAAGETFRTFAVPLLDNPEPQNSRALQLHLSDPTGDGVLDPPPEATLRTLVILDDDRPGDLDFTFNANLGVGAYASRLALTPAQQILAAGSSLGLVRLDPTGAIDHRFQAERSLNPAGLLADNSNRVWADNWEDRLCILAPDGTVVWTSVWAGWPFKPRTLALQPDQKVVATLGRGLIRLLQTGDNDPSFDDRGAGDLFVESAVIQPDGRILCGGRSATPGSRRCLVRLNSDGTIDDAFAATAASFEMANDSGMPGVYDILLQPDGRILVGGVFDRVGGKPNLNLVRLTASGSLDEEWNAGADFTGPVTRLALQGDGRILTVGTFSTVQSVAQANFARLEPNGALDTSFAPVARDVLALALQGDGHIVIGGTFFTVNGQSRSGVARLRGAPEAAAGVVSFIAAPASVLESVGAVTVRVQRSGGARGRIVVPYAVSGGTAIVGQDIGATSGMVEFADGDSAPKTITLRVLADGLPDGDKTVELSLGVPIGGAVLDERCTVGWTIEDVDCVIEFAATEYTARESDATATLRLLRRGNLRGPAAVGYATRADSAIPGQDYYFEAGVARFADGQSETTLTVNLVNDAWGQLDTEFWVDLDTPSNGCRLGANQSARITIADDDRPGAPRVFFGGLPAWAPTPQFNGSLFAEVIDLAAGGNRRVLALFRGIRDPVGNGLPGPSSVVRFNTDGSFDTSFWPGGGPADSTLPESDALALAPRSDGSVLVGTPTRLVRINASGQAEPGAFGGVIGLVQTLLAFSDGSFLVGGGLQFDRPEPWCHLVRRNPDGTAEPSFQTVVATLGGDPRGAVILAVAADNQGRFLVGGAFDVIQGGSRWGLARLSSSGELDRSFDVRFYGPTPGEGEGRGTVRRIVAQPDGRILVAGQFNRVGDVERHNLARLMPDGSIDATFAPALPFGWMDSDLREAIADVGVQPDGRIVVAGSRFASDGWSPRDVLAEGRIARLKPDGSLDSLFDANGTIATLLTEYQAGTINRVLAEPDGSLLIGGRFNRLNGLPCAGVVRINGGVALGFAQVRRTAADRLVLVANTPLPTVLQLQRSVDLQSWTNLVTKEVPAGPLEWEVTLPEGSNAEFFRLRAKP